MVDESPKLYDLAQKTLSSIQTIIWKWLARSQEYLFGASLKYPIEWGRLEDFSSAYQDSEGREPWVSLKEVQEKVNSKVYFVIIVLG